MAQVRFRLEAVNKVLLPMKSQRLENSSENEQSTFTLPLDNPHVY